MLFHNTPGFFREFLNMRPCSNLMGASLLALVTAMPALAAAPQPESEVEELVVTGAPYAVSLDTVTTSLSIVTREDLDVAPPAGLGDLLSGQPGLRSTAYGPGASRPVIRGLAGPRVLVLQNGVGLVDASALSPDHAVASEPGEASRIEVLRGPSTLAYGGSGIGGVVNIIDDRIPSRRPEAPLEGRIAVSASSVDSGQSINGGLKVAVGPVVFALDAVHRSSEDYEVPVAPVSKRLTNAEGLTIDPATIVRNADVSLDAYGAGISYVGEDGYLGL
jgi:iron complex outermembrane receptor protein